MATPIYFIERYFVDNEGNLISESNEILDVITNQELIVDATVNNMIRKDQGKEISRAALAEEHVTRYKKRKSLRPTVPMMKAVSDV